MSAIVTIGIDLAKNVFAVHGVDATGKNAMVRPSVARPTLLELIASLPPCLIGMEACSGAHHWEREFQESQAIRATTIKNGVTGPKIAQIATPLISAISG